MNNLTSIYENNYKGKINISLPIKSDLKQKLYTKINNLQYLYFPFPTLFSKLINESEIKWENPNIPIELKNKNLQYFLDRNYFKVKINNMFYEFKL